MDLKNTDMTLETLKPGDIVYLKNNPDLPLLVLFIQKDTITVLLPDVITQSTLPKVAFTTKEVQDYHVTINLSAIEINTGDNKV